MAKTAPVQFRIPQTLLSRIDAAAKRAGLSRTAWVFGACEHRLAVHAEFDATAGTKA